MFIIRIWGVTYYRTARIHNTVTDTCARSVDDADVYNLYSRPHYHTYWSILENAARRNSLIAGRRDARRFSTMSRSRLRSAFFFFFFSTVHKSASLFPASRFSKQYSRSTPVFLLFAAARFRDTVRVEYRKALKGAHRISPFCSPRQHTFVLDSRYARRTSAVRDVIIYRIRSTLLQKILLFSTRGGNARVSRTQKETQVQGEENVTWLA